METCCETDASSQAHDHIDDPTLAGCCLRDLKEQAYNQHLLQRLAECDVSEARQRMEAGVIRHRLQDIPEQVSDVDSLATDSDDDGLRHAKQNRLLELQQQARIRASEQELGLGLLQDMPSNALQDLVQNTDMPIVCHLVAEGSWAGDELDELLQKLAGHYRGTHFCRTPIATERDVGFRHLAVERLPGLCIFIKATLASQILQDEVQEEGDVVEERVMSYLRQCGALKLSRATQQDAGIATGDSDAEEAGESSEWQEACNICSRRYHHEHVRAVTKGNQQSGYDSA